MMISETRRRLDAGPLKRGLDGNRTQLVGGDIGECAVERANRGAGSADDDDIVGHGHLLLLNRRT